MRALIAVMLLMLGLLQIAIWFGDGSVPEVWSLQRAVEVQQAENARLKERNDRLAAEVDDLKHGLAAIEEVARNEMGMIGRDEVFYLVVEK